MLLVYFRYEAYEPSFICQQLASKPNWPLVSWLHFFRTLGTDNKWCCHSRRPHVLAAPPCRGWGLLIPLTSCTPIWWQASTCPSTHGWWNQTEWFWSERKMSNFHQLQEILLILFLLDLLTIGCKGRLSLGLIDFFREFREMQNMQKCWKINS